MKSLKNYFVFGLLMILATGCSKVTPASKEDMKFTKNSLCLKSTKYVYFAGVYSSFRLIKNGSIAYTGTDVCSEVLGPNAGRDSSYPSNYDCTLNVELFMQRTCGGAEYSPAVFSLDENLLSIGCYRTCNE
jgi:hypothetical protein